MKPGLIVYCNLTLQTVRKKQKGRRLQNKIITLKRVVFSWPYSGERSTLYYDNLEDRRIIKLTKLSEDLAIINVQILEELGYKQKHHEQRT